MNEATTDHGGLSATGPAEGAVQASYFNYSNSLPHVSCITASMLFRAALEDVDLAKMPRIDTVHMSTPPIMAVSGMVALAISATATIRSRTRLNLNPPLHNCNLTHNLSTFSTILHINPYTPTASS